MIVEPNAGDQVQDNLNPVGRAYYALLDAAVHAGIAVAGRRPRARGPGRRSTDPGRRAARRVHPLSARRRDAVQPRVRSAHRDIGAGTASIAREAPTRPAWLQRLAEVGASPSDSEELRLRKAVLGAVLGADREPGVRVGGDATRRSGCGWRPRSPSHISSPRRPASTRSRGHAILAVPAQPAVDCACCCRSRCNGAWVASSLLGRLPVGVHLADGRVPVRRTREKRPPGSWHSCRWSRCPSAIDPALAATRRASPVRSRLRSSLLNIAGVATTASALLGYFVREREREQAKSERLLLNVLPAPVASRLEAGRRNHCRRLRGGDRAVRRYRRLHAAVRAALGGGSSGAVSTGCSRPGIRLAAQSRRREDQNDW